MNWCVFGYSVMLMQSTVVTVWLCIWNSLGINEPVFVVQGPKHIMRCTWLFSVLLPMSFVVAACCSFQWWWSWQGHSILVAHSISCFWQTLFLVSSTALDEVLAMVVVLGMIPFLTNLHASDACSMIIDAKNNVDVLDTLVMHSLKSAYDNPKPSLMPQYGARTPIFWKAKVITTICCNGAYQNRLVHQKLEDHWWNTDNTNHVVRNKQTTTNLNSTWIMKCLRQHNYMHDLKLGSPHELHLPAMTTHHQKRQVLLVAYLFLSIPVAIFDSSVR